MHATYTFDGWTIGGDMATADNDQGFLGFDITEREVRATALVALCLGVLLGSTWVSRQQNVFGWDALLPLARVIAAVWLIVFALYARTHVPKDRHLVLPAGCSLAAHGACVALAGLLHDTGSLPALGFASAFFEGTAFAATELVALAIAARSLSGKMVGVAIAGGFLIGNVYDTLMMSAPGAVITVQWVIGKAVALALAVVLAARVDSRRPAVDEHDRHPRGDADEYGRIRGIAFPIALCVVLMLIQGVFSQVTGLGGVGAAAFYGLGSGFVVLVVRVLTLAYCAALDRDVPLLSPLCLCAVVWVASLGLVALRWDVDRGAAGALLLEAGYSTLQVLPLVALVQRSGDRISGDRSGDVENDFGAVYVVAGVAAALSLSNQPARFVGSIALDPSVFDAQLVGTLAVCGSVVIAGLLAGGLIMAARGGEGTVDARSAYESDDGAATLAGKVSNDPLLSGEIAFIRGFREVCEERHVTPRERDVLFEAIHGYTIDNIAVRLSISRETVKTTLSKAYAHVGVSGKQEFLQLVEARKEQGGMRA